MQKLQKRYAILLLVILIVASTRWIIFNNQNSELEELEEDEKQNAQGAWFYPNTAIDNISNLEIDFVLLSVNGKQLNQNSEYYNASYKQLISEYITIFQSYEIMVKLMTLEDPSFSFLNSTNNIIEHLNGVFMIMNEFSLKEFHLDIEPHALPAWKNGDDKTKEAILNEFIQVINQIYTIKSDYETKNNVNFVMSLAITWWLSKNYDLHSMNADILYLMIYGGIGGTVEEITQRVFVDRNYYIGLGVDEFNTTENLYKTSRGVMNYYDNDSRYLGNTFFSLNKLLMKQI